MPAGRRQSPVSVKPSSTALWPIPDWVRARLAEAEAGTPRRAKEWSKLAMEWAGLEIRWTTTASKAAAEALEDKLIAAHDSLWNRRRTVVVRLDAPSSTSVDP